MTHQRMFRSWTIAGDSLIKDSPRDMIEAEIDRLNWRELKEGETIELSALAKACFTELHHSDDDRNVIALADSANDSPFMIVAFELMFTNGRMRAYFHGRYVNADGLEFAMFLIEWWPNDNDDGMQEVIAALRDGSVRIHELVE